MALCSSSATKASYPNLSISGSALGSSWLNVKVFLSKTEISKCWHTLSGSCPLKKFPEGIHEVWNDDENYSKTFSCLMRYTWRLPTLSELVRFLLNLIVFNIPHGGVSVSYVLIRFLAGYSFATSESETALSSSVTYNLLWRSSCFSEWNAKNEQSSAVQIKAYLNKEILKATCGCFVCLWK